MNLTEATIKALTDKDYKSKTIACNNTTIKKGSKWVSAPADLSSLRKYAEFLDKISDLLDSPEYEDVFSELYGAIFGEAVDEFVDSLTNEEIRIENAIKEIESNMIGK